MMRSSETTTRQLIVRGRAQRNAAGCWPVRITPTHRVACRRRANGGFGRAPPLTREQGGDILYSSCQDKFLLKSTLIKSTCYNVPILEDIPLLQILFEPFPCGRRVSHLTANPHLIVISIRCALRPPIIPYPGCMIQVRGPVLSPTRS